MKKHLLAFLLCCVSLGAVHAATVSGVVSSTTTCSVLAGQKVYLRDSLPSAPYLDSALTNSSGFYSMTIPASWTSKMFLITIPACGSVWNTGVFYTMGSNVTANSVVCGQAKHLYGNLMLGSVANTGPAKVWLVKVQRNYPTAGDTTLTAVDSNVLTSGGYYDFMRVCAPNDTFLVKAALMTGHPSYTGYLPSYDSSLTWSGARRYYGSNFTNFAGSGYNIYLIPGINLGGAGFIGGSVLVGANKQAKVGDPLASRILILANATTGAPVAYTYSDASGKFSFPSVGVGTYKLFGDAWGLYNVPLTVSITNTQKTVNNIIFEENYGENTFKGRFSATAVGPVTGPLAEVSVYPNPATTSITLKGRSTIKGAKTLVLRDMVGATVMSQTYVDGQAMELAIATLPAGSYVLQLTTELGSASFKVVK